MITGIGEYRDISMIVPLFHQQVILYATRFLYSVKYYNSNGSYQSAVTLVKHRAIIAMLSEPISCAAR